MRSLGLRACLLAGCLTLGMPLQGAQQPTTSGTIQVADVRPIVAGRPPFPLVEPLLAVNPRDPSNLLVSAMATSADHAVVYASWDAGRSWTEVRNGQGRTFDGGDPVVVFDGNGRAYFSTVAPAFSVWRSDDKGRTWRGPVHAGSASRSDDRDWLAVSPTPGGDALPVYGAAKTPSEKGRGSSDVILTTVSRDGGRTFAEPRRTAPDRGYLQAITALLVRRDGSVLMAYPVNDSQLPDGRYHGAIRVRTSADGLSFSSPTVVSEYLSYGTAGDDRRWKGLGVTSIAEDRSHGQYAGSLYMTWAAPIDDRLQIVATRSRDGGRTWSTPARVNRAGFRSNHSSPMVAVNADGVVAVSWMDRRDDPRDACFRPYVALSSDGGQSFSVEHRVAQQPTCPGEGSRWMNGGETHGLAALPSGDFRIVWTSGSANDLRLWTAVLRASPRRQ